MVMRSRNASDSSNSEPPPVVWRIGICVAYNEFRASEHPNPSLVSSPLRIALGSDEKSHVTDFLVRELEARGCEVALFGALSLNASESKDWPDVAERVAVEVAAVTVDEGILLCWTGTGVSIAANKVVGIRAALCADAVTAHGAKAWNQANVLCLSLRTTTETIAQEILDAWFSARTDSSEAGNVDKVNDMDARRTTAPLSR